MYIFVNDFLNKISKFLNKTKRNSDQIFYNCKRKTIIITSTLLPIVGVVTTTSSNNLFCKK
jgi:hypothetical protein